MDHCVLWQLSPRWNGKPSFFIHTNNHPLFSSFPQKGGLIRKVGNILAKSRENWVSYLLQHSPQEGKILVRHESPRRERVPYSNGLKIILILYSLLMLQRIFSPHSYGSSCSLWRAVLWREREILGRASTACEDWDRNLNNW